MSGMNNGGALPYNNNNNNGTGMLVFSATANYHHSTTPERETTTAASKRGRDGSPTRYHCEPTLPLTAAAVTVMQQQLQVPPAVLPSMTESASTVAVHPLDGAPPKRTRTNNYRPPQKVPPSFTSQVGSFALSQHVMGNNNPSRSRTREQQQQQQQQVACRSVGLRRQLSSSKIEPFLSSGDDAMDVDVEQGRPRSMSL